MPENDFLTGLGLNAVVTRMKRISDSMIHDGRRMYKELGFDIEPNWFAVFKLLRGRGPMSVTEISDAIGLSHPSVISIINKMVKAGYLIESRDEADSRRRILALTPLAEEKFPDFERVWDAGTTGVKRMMFDTDIHHMLNVLEDRLAEKGFRQRAIEELNRFNSIEIVEYSDKYREDFANLNYEWIAKHFEIEQHDRDQLEDPRKSVMEGGGQVFFAIVDGKTAGTVALINAGDGVYELAKMAVSPDYRGYKLSNRLLQACIDYGRKIGGKTIFLESNTKQMAAIHLYRKFGFKETPLDPNSHFKRVNIRMELDL